MASKLEWIMALVDRTSSPADKIAGKLGLVEKRLNAVAKAEASAKTDSAKDRLSMSRMSLELQKQDMLTQKLTGATGDFLSKWGVAFGVVGAVLGPLALVGSAVSGIVGRLVSGSAQLLTNFAQAAISAASFKENNLIAFRTILGSDEAAGRVMNKLVKFAATTPFETKDIMEIGKNLLVGGFSEREIPVVLKAVGDVGAMKGFDKQIIDRLVSSLSQVKAKGKLTGETMERLAEAGVPAGRIYEKLGQTLGVTSQQAQKMMSAGKIDANKGIFAIVKTIRDDMSGGKLGNMMDQTSQTVQGLWSTIASKPFEWMMDLNNSNGFKSLKGFLANVAAVLDNNEGKIKARATRLFDWMMKSLFGDVSGSDGPAKLEDMLGRVMKGFDYLFAGVKTGAEFVKGALGGFFDGMGLGKKLDDLLAGDMTEEKMARMAKVGGELGRSFGEAAASLLKFFSVMNSMGSSAAAFFNGPLARAVAGQFMPSGPSEEDLTRKAIEGELRRRMEASVNLQPALTVGQLGSAGVTNSQANTINVNLPPGSTANPTEIKEAAKQGAEEGMAMWEAIAMQAGALGG